MMQLRPQNWCYWLGVGSLFTLILLCIAWEWKLAPLRPGGSWMVLKVLPLLIPLRGILKRDLYTLQWSSMLILFYLCEGLVRATSDSGLSSTLAWIETVLVTVFFGATMLYVYPYKKAAKALAQQTIHKASR